jgi:hypothetical protein
MFRVNPRRGKDTPAASPAQQEGLQPPPPSTTHLQQAVLQGLEEYRGDGSAIAYDSKRMEYREFCDSVYSNLSHFKYIVDDHKMFYFMFYCAMREQKARGGKSRRTQAPELPQKFNRADYDAVMAKYSVWWETETETSELPHPASPCGIQSLMQYKAAVKGEWEHQVSMNSNNLSWDLIFTQKTKKIFDNVKKRKAAVRRANYSEKVSHEFAPYLAVERYPDMEKHMWGKGDGSQRFAFSWLRNRMCLLFSTSAILRCESLFRAELSDFVSIKFKAPKDVHAMHAVIMQIMKGESLINLFFPNVLFF